MSIERSRKFKEDWRLDTAIHCDHYNPCDCPLCLIQDHCDHPKSKTGVCGRKDCPDKRRGSKGRKRK